VKFSKTSSLEVLYYIYLVKSTYISSLEVEGDFMKIYQYGDSKNIIGKQLKDLRTKRKLSQKELAEQLQLLGLQWSDLTVLRAEQGTRFVADYEVAVIASFFQVSADFLLNIV
jgi:DNA-binding XRE family transcriptional regulator